MNTLPLKAAGQVHRSAVGLPGLNVNMDTLLYNISSSFNPLHRDCLIDYHVKAVNPSQVCMSVVMPNEMLQSFSILMESLGGFFRVVNIKSRSSRASLKAHDLDEISDRDERIRLFRSEVCTLFEGFINQGCDKNEAIKRTNSSLKAQSNPWASWQVVENVLRSEGCLRKSGHMKGGENL
jgi:hypothetical protein